MCSGRCDRHPGLSNVYSERAFEVHNKRADGKRPVLSVWFRFREVQLSDFCYGAVATNE